MKPGDKVRIVNKVPDCKAKWNSDMDNYIGKEYCIDDYASHYENHFKLKGDCWKWPIEALELIEEEKPKMKTLEEVIDFCQPQEMEVSNFENFNNSCKLKVLFQGTNGFASLDRYGKHLCWFTYARPIKQKRQRLPAEYIDWIFDWCKKHGVLPSDVEVSVDKLNWEDINILSYQAASPYYIRIEGKSETEEEIPSEVEE